MYRRRKLRRHISGVTILIVVLVAWISMIVVTFVVVHPKADKVSFAEGKFAATYPAVPNTCPHDNPFLYHMNLSQCDSLEEIARNECFSSKICLPHCPSMTYTPNLKGNIDIEKERMNWNYSRTLVVCLKSKKETSWATPPETFDEFVVYVHKGLCAENVFRCNSFFNKICLPIELGEPLLKHMHPTEEKKKDERSGISITMKRRSHEMFILWIIVAPSVTIFFFFVYLILFLYCIRFTVYASLIFFFTLLVTALCYSLGMIVYSAILGQKAHEIDPDITLGIDWKYWIIFAAVVFFFFCMYIDFILKCHYSLPKAVQFLTYVNIGIGGVRSTLAFLLLCLLVQVLILASLVMLNILIYDAGDHKRRLMDTSSDCICINGYVKGSECNKTSFDNWCRDRYSGGPCLEGGCDLYAVELNRSSIVLIIFLVLATYYILWFVKGAADMILGTAFVHWYRDNFSSSIPFKHIMKTTVFCLKYQIGTLSIGALVMFLIGWIHVLFQFIEHLVLFTFEIKKVRRKRMIVTIVERLSKITSPLIYITAGVYNLSYAEASKKVDIAMAAKIKNIRLINRLVDMVIFICALSVVIITLIGLLSMYAYPNTFIDTTKYRDIFGIMTTPIIVLIIIVIATYFLVANVLSVYSISVNAIFLSYISDIPMEVSRKRKFASSKTISEDMNPDKFDVLGKLNDLGEGVTPGDKSAPSNEPSPNPTVGTTNSVSKKE